ncbi:uncharacterized protein [Diadema setosum]|uniref:uncharacterized protein n=1 Tax=Diadema setosum TaxID=31175 RepID=UPI003B3A86DC
MRRLILVAVLCALSAPTALAQCEGLVAEEFQTTGAEVIIGVMQDFYGKSSDEERCEGPETDQELYEAAKTALAALPSGIMMPKFQIGLERYESCGIPERAVRDATHYASQIVTAVNVSDHLMPCLDSVFRPGLIGPFTSGEAEAVAPVLSAIGMPLISHAASAPSLTDAEMDGSFLRTIPSDNVQAQVMVELLAELGWTYVQVLHSEGSYGEGGADAFLDAARGQVEVASLITMPKAGADYDAIIAQLVGNNDAKAVVVWASPAQTVGLLTAVQSAGGAALELQFVGSDYVAETMDSQLAGAALNMAAKGLITIGPGEYNNPQFQAYLAASSLAGNGNPYVPAMIDAAHVYVDALVRAHDDLCGPTTMGVCRAMKALGSAEFLEQYVRTADFTGVTGRRIAFDEHGNPVAPAYEIRQYKSMGAAFKTQMVGSWAGSGSLNIQTNNFEFFLQGGIRSNSPPPSVCSSGSCPVVYDHYDVFKIAGIFPIHDPGCSTFSGHSGFVHSQAMMWALDKVNRDSSILPGIQLKPVLGETCSSVQQASAAAYDIVQRFERQPGRAFGRYHGDEDYYIAGVISYAGEEETVEIDEVLQPLGVPQISDTARLPALSDKTQYPYFSRMVAPSCSMVTAVLEFLQEHGLTYVQVVQSNDGIYNNTAAVFIERAREYGVCVAQSITFQPTTDYNGVIDRLLAKASADVVVNFADHYETQFFFSALERRELPGEHLQVVHVFTEDTMYLDSWDRNIHVDSITLARVTTPVEDFTNYFAALTPGGVMQEDLFGDSVENTWFYEYWMKKFECQLSYPGLPQRYSTPCTGMESLSRDDIPSTEGVINAVHVYAQALSALQRDKCVNTGAARSGICQALLDTTPSEWTRYIREVNFMSVSGSMQEVEFDAEGDGPVALNFVALTSTLTNNPVAKYDENGLVILDNRFSVGAGKESTCRGLCAECETPENLGATYMRIPGDFDIPAVLWLSEEGAPANLTCGATRYTETMAIQIIKYALDQINNNSKILPGIKLGLTVIDSCGQFLVAARQLTAVMGSTTLDLPATGPMIGVLGPVREYLQGHVASDVTSPFKIPTIGFTPASPSVFSDEGPYPASSLVSTAPSYDQEARAVVDVLVHMGWHHVLFVYSHSYYGHAGNTTFNEAAVANGICVRESIGIDLDSPQAIHDDIVTTIRNYNISVVVAFVESGDARALLTAEKTLPKAGPTSVDKITWVGSDKWFTDPEVDVTQGLEDIARGAIVVTNYIVDLQPLKNHLSNLDLEKEMDKNHWLRNYVVDELAEGCSSSQCVKDVDLGKQGRLPAYTATLINAVHVLAQALHNKIQITCGNGEYVEHEYKRAAYVLKPINETAPLCSEFYDLHYHHILYAIKSAYVESGAGGRPFWFENRQGPAEYSIINFQGDGITGSFVPIGEYVSGQLTMDDRRIYLYNPDADKLIPAPAVCETRVEDPTSCPVIDVQPPSSWSWNQGAEAWVVVVLIVAAVGGLVALASIPIFVSHRKSSQIKRANPFLMCMVALGVILMYLNNVWYMVVPGESSCGMQRWMTSFSYAVVYAALATKAVAYSNVCKKFSNSTFTTQPVQILLFFTLLITEVVLVTEWLILDPASGVEMFEVDGLGCSAYAGIACDHSNSSTVLSMVYVYILVFLTFVLSFFSAGGSQDSATKKERRTLVYTSLLSICFLVAWSCCYTLMPRPSYHTPALLIGITVDATSILLFYIAFKLVAIFSGDEDSDDESVESVDVGGDIRKEKLGLDNGGAVINDADHQTPF